jgi:hypothetical protein
VLRLGVAILALAPALGAGASDLELSWPPAAAAAGGDLRVERRSPGGSWGEVARLPLSAVSFIDSGLDRDATWCYRVRLARPHERVRTHAAEHCVGPAADSAAPRGRRTRVRGGWLQEVEP